MLLVTFVLLLSALADTVVHIVNFHRKVLRVGLAVIAILSFMAASGIILLYELNVFSLAVVLIYVYRAFNMSRVIKGRMHPLYLWNVTYRSTLWLVAAQFVVLGAWELWSYHNEPLYIIRAVLLIFQVAISLVFLRTVSGHSKRMNMAAQNEVVTSSLPSLTVAIPARNESEELQECITSLLASNYPKLEILVLDDCSQTARTPEIIRSFAHDGVRFIKGDEPQDTWLAKNQAYDTLAKAASGEIIIFCGVDVRYDEESLKKMVAYAIAKQKNMLCILPRNVLPSGQVPLIQPMRYAWELVLPRRLFKRPPVLSSCWLITKKALLDAGSFEAAARMVVPEAYFASREASRDAYSFIASGQTFGVTSTKNIQAQRDTAVRVSYPQIHRRPEMVALITLSIVVWTCMPLSVLAAAVTTGHYYALVLLGVASLVIILNILAYRAVYKLAYDIAPLFALLNLPAAAVVYIALLNYSMFKYEFSEVIWKGRNICLPVMHVIPRLPRI